MTLFHGKHIISISIMLAIFLTTISCTNRTNFQIYSTNQEQCVTVITREEIRYIINGKYNLIPKTNFVKIDISGIDPIGDEIGVCWKTNNLEWEIVNHGSRVIENKLDTTKYKFNTSWEKDDDGIPNVKKYIQPNCGTLGFELMMTFPKNGNIILKN